ncbi:MAG TPA: TadE/TadG family type IV pilus assembly protein [Baekduia sp.]|nr:TadE/TadG family type IV pilus assembly protein [Baekduia sp.]
MSWLASRRRHRWLASGEAGESMVEFALVLPLLLLGLIGVVQFALVHHAQNVATTAAQEGARLGAAEDGDPSLAEARTLDVLRSGLGGVSDGFAVTAEDSDEWITVTTTGGYPLIIPWLASQTISIDAAAEMRKEGFRSGP